MDRGIDSAILASSLSDPSQLLSPSIITDPIFTQVRLTPKKIQNSIISFSL